MTPQSRRHWAKRKIEQAIGNMDTAGLYVAEVGEAFKDREDKYFTYLCQVVAHIEQVKDGIKSFGDAI